MANSFRTFVSTVLAVVPGIALPAADAQMTVIDPSNLLHNANTAARALEQINNQVTMITNQMRQLENDARNLTRLGDTFAPEVMTQLREMDRLITEARGIALSVNDTRNSLEQLYSGDYRNTDLVIRAQAAARQIDASRAALQTSLVLQAQATEQLRSDQTTLQSLASASSAANGSLAAQQATNELLTFQAQQAMRLQTLLVTQSRADALERAREMETRAQARAQHDHFFGNARVAHSGTRPWP